MKKILVIHNRYQEFGGEDNAVEKEVEFLTSHENFKVKSVFLQNSYKEIMKTILIFIFNRNIFFDLKIKNEIKKFNPDLIYVHNTWFIISLGLFKILKNLNINTVVKLHNFRYFCTHSLLASNHFKNEIECRACGNKRKKFIFFNKYFEESIFKSIFVLKYGKKYIKILKNSNFKIAVLNDFHRNFIQSEFGINNNRIVIIPNFIGVKNRNFIKNKEIIYAGRISHQKGIEFLVNEFVASDLIDYNLIIIGDGPQLNYFRNKFHYTNVIFLGYLQNEEVLKRIQNASCVVTATKMFEGQPTLLCEASLSSKISLFPNNGGINEYFPNNYPFMFDNSKKSSLSKKLNLLLDEDLINLYEEKNYETITSILNKNKILEIFEKL